MSEEIYSATNDNSFFDSIPWEKISYNKIDKESYDRIKAKVKQCYVTFLGPPDALSFYMFKPLTWSEFKSIKEKKLDKDTTHEYIISNCILYPQTDPLTINDEDGGIILTLVYQILTVSNFLDNPLKALDIIYEA